MNALQTEYTALRAAGMKPREVIASMLDWRRKAATTLLLAGHVVPVPITKLVGELMAEAEELRGARRYAGVRP